jgi:tetratricopeptide (TPR) repeat protein
MRHEVGNTYQNLDLYPAAVEQLRAALRLYERARGPDHEDTVRALSDLALALKKAGRLDEAEPLLRRALPLLRRLYGAEHEFTRVAYNNRAMLLHEQGKVEEAERLFRQTLAADRRVNGDAHPQTLITLENLVVVLERKGDFAEADAFRRVGLTACAQAYGEGHPITRMVRKDLNTAAVRRWNKAALEASSRGKFAEAEALLKQALPEARRIWGAEDDETQTVLFNLVMALRDQHKSAEAEPLARELLRLQRAHAGDKDIPRPDTSLSLIGGVLSDCGKAAEAEPLLRECLALRQKMLPAGHWLTANTQSWLGGCLAAQQKFAEAEPLLLEGYEGMGKAKDALPRRKKEALERIVALYVAWGKPDKADAWRKKLPPADKGKSMP